MIYFCCDEKRRDGVRGHPELNGIDFIEVLDDPNDPDELRQRTLHVFFLNDLAPGVLGPDNVRIVGGERIRHIRITDVSTPVSFSPPSFSLPFVSGNLLVVEVAEPGDFSTYTLQLVKGPAFEDPPEGFDPVLSVVDFSFKAACASDFDCLKRRVCPPPVIQQPEFSYLAKDYASFRRLMLDRMSLLMPEWTERNPADIGIMLVDLLAYVGDYLSYEQDAVATEAYLRTARRRTSVKRHVRLIDYFVHEGSNARTWVQVEVLPGAVPTSLEAEPVGIKGPRKTAFLTRVAEAPVVMAPDTPELAKARTAFPETFEAVHGITLRHEHNRIPFYTWGDEACCLPKGATRATLRGAFPHLGEGDVLVFIETRGPQTGEPEDANPGRRHAVRLRSAKVTEDPAGGRFERQEHDGSVPVTEIEWAKADALPFPFCVSSRSGTSFFDNVSVALGNIVLADHGLTIVAEELRVPPRPNPALSRVLAESGDPCRAREPVPSAPRFRPRLKQGPVTHAPEYRWKDKTMSASGVMRWPDKTPLPVIRLRELDPPGESWDPQPDLLSSEFSDKHFVAEIETDGTAFLRFGDGRFGARPESGLRLEATYRVGNGLRGNVGNTTLAHLVSLQPGLADIVSRVWNPMAAAGGRAPETIEEVRQSAPSAFRVQQCAVTEEDYAAKAQTCLPDVQKAAATFRWTGSWRTVFITADRLGGAAVTPTFEVDLGRCLERFRMAGQDLEVDGPVPVPLEIDMTVCVKQGYFVSDVRAELVELFSNRMLPDGRKGVFHPDNFTFGQPVFLSPLYAAAQAVEGVASVNITKFQRRGIDSTEGIDSGQLKMNRLEIARLDNDPNFRERGVFNLQVLGTR